MNEFIFNGASSLDFGLRVETASFGVPQQRTLTQSIPFRDGYLDFTKSSGKVYYDARQIAYTMILNEETESEAYYSINKIHEWLMTDGDRVLEDPRFNGYVFTNVSLGTFAYEPVSGHPNVIRIGLSFTADPYMERKNSVNKTIITDVPSVSTKGYGIYIDGSTCYSYEMPSKTMGSNLSISDEAYDEMTGKWHVACLYSGVFEKTTYDKYILIPKKVTGSGIKIFDSVKATTGCSTVSGYNNDDYFLIRVLPSSVGFTVRMNITNEYTESLAAAYINATGHYCTVSNSEKRFLLGGNSIPREIRLEAFRDVVMDVNFGTERVKKSEINDGFNLVRLYNAAKEPITIYYDNSDKCLFKA